MGWKMLSAKAVLASKALVKEFTEMEACPGDRPLSERRMQVYERILRAGEFRPVTWASAVCHETAGTYRVNGKHTSLLLSRMSPLPDFHVVVERYECPRMRDVSALYNTFDSRLGARTTNDINHAFAETVRELAGLPRQVINLSVTALAFCKWGTKAGEVTPAERAEELFDNQAFVAWLAKTVPTGARYRHLLRSPVVAAMVATFNRSRAAANEFWAHVREEDDASNKSPARVLARYLVRASLGGRHTSARQGGEAADGRAMYAKCIHAWNAYRAGETTALNYHAKADLPTPR